MLRQGMGHSHDKSRYGQRLGQRLGQRQGQRLRQSQSRRDFLGSGAAAGAALPLSGSLSGLAWAAAPELSQAMGKAAGAWLASLDARQQPHARMAWADPLRNAWHYVPRSRPGVALRDMKPAQAA